MPAACYTPSPRPYPSRLQDPAYAADFELRRVRSNGQIKWQGELIFIARPLIGEVIGLRENDDGNAEAYFGPVHLGTINAVTLKFERRRRPTRKSNPTAGARVAHKAHSPREKVENPGCGLVDNSPLHATEV